MVGHEWMYLLHWQCLESWVRSRGPFLAWGSGGWRDLAAATKCNVSICVDKLGFFGFGVQGLFLSELC